MSCLVNRAVRNPMVAARKTLEFMALAEFLAWDAPGGATWQPIEGIPQAMAPASGIHVVIQNEVGRVIGNHLAENRPGCRVLANPGVVPRVQSEHNFRIPNIAVICVPVSRNAIEIADPILPIEILLSGDPVETWTNVWAYTNMPSA